MAVVVTVVPMPSEDSRQKDSRQKTKVNAVTTVTVELSDILVTQGNAGIAPHGGSFVPAPEDRSALANPC